MKKVGFRICIYLLLLALAGAVCFVPDAVCAADREGALPLSIEGGHAKLLDAAPSTRETVRPDTALTLSSSESFTALYLVFWEEPVGVTVSCGTEQLHFDAAYLSTYLELPEDFAKKAAGTVQLSFDEQTQLSDLYALDASALPDWVQRWEGPYDRADILLVSTHADDEQLFFAGIMPYYAGELGYRVQIAYFTDHRDTPGRRHELLAGLWTVGMTHYPVVGFVPDAYSESSRDAIQNLKAAGYTETDALAYQVGLLRRFRPQVVIGHDLNGEYGHGQHRLNAECLAQAAELAKDETQFPESAAQYGVWDTPKLYLHLYEQNKITLNWDVPLAHFGGKTAFQMTQAGFACHASQQRTWFRKWLCGANGEITKASQIKTYSPCAFGLYRSTVGEDAEKNDFFEHLMTYDEQDRVEAEHQREVEEARRKAEEKARAEEEARTQKAKEEASAAVPENVLPRKNTAMRAVPGLILLGVLLAVLIFLAIQKKKKKEGR